MKNYLNRMAVMALALMLAVCVPLAVGAEEVAEDVYVQGEDMSLTETEVVSEIPAVSASVRITSLNLGRCEYFGDSLSLKANLENADGAETVVWQVCTNYVEGGNNTWTQFGTGTVASVNITPAIGQCAYRCVLSTGAVSRVYRVEKTFAARPEEVDTATEETETETEETVVETEATVPADENETAAETVTESAEEHPENQETEETNPVETEEVEFEDNFEDVVVFEDEFEFEDEEWLEFDDNDWGSTDSDFFSALDELANNYEECGALDSAHQARTGNQIGRIGRSLSRENIGSHLHRRAHLQAHRTREDDGRHSINGKGRVQAIPQGVAA